VSSPAAATAAAAAAAAGGGDGGGVVDYIRQGDVDADALSHIHIAFRRTAAEFRPAPPRCVESTFRGRPIRNNF